MDLIYRPLNFFEGLCASSPDTVLRRAESWGLHDATLSLKVDETIGIIGVLALTANSLCLLLLWRHRADDINMSSVWLCSRNDIIANVSVLCAGLGVWLTGSGWPVILVGLGLAALFLRSALFVLRGAITELHTTNA